MDGLSLAWRLMREKVQRRVLVAALAMVVIGCGVPQEDLDAARAELEAARKEHEDALAEKDERLAELEASLEGESQKARELQVRVDSLETKVASLESALDVADQTEKELQSQIEEKQRQMDALAVTFDPQMSEVKEAISSRAIQLACEWASERVKTGEEEPPSEDAVADSVADSLNEEAAEDPAWDLVLEVTGGVWKVASHSDAVAEASRCHETRVAEVRQLLAEGMQPLWEFIKQEACAIGRQLAADAEESGEYFYSLTAAGFTDADAEKLILAAIASDEDASILFDSVGNDLTAVYANHPEFSHSDDAIRSFAEDCYFVGSARWPKPEGTYEVGSKIAVGTWVTDEYGAAGICYWARLDGYNNILDNGFASNTAPMRFTVRSSDRFIEISGDCTFVFQG